MSAAHRLIAIVMVSLSGCGFGTDAATRLAYDIEAEVDGLANENGAAASILHETPSRSGECAGPWKLQLDQVGAMIIWCYDGAGNTVSSHSTSYHSRYVDTPRTFLVEKGAGETLTIDLERQGGRAVIVDVR